MNIETANVNSQIEIFLNIVIYENFDLFKQRLSYNTIFSRQKFSSWSEMTKKCLQKHRGYIDGS